MNIVCSIEAAAAVHRAELKKVGERICYCLDLTTFAGQQVHAPSSSLAEISTD